MNAPEEAFIKTAKLSEKHHINRYFVDKEENAVQTRSVIGTNQYGNPSIEYFHDGTIDDIANDLSAILERDFSNNLNLNLYQSKPVPKVATVSTAPKPQSPLFDLFGLSETQKSSIYAAKTQNTSSTVSTLFAERPFSSEKKTFFQENMLIVDSGQIGRLTGLNNCCVRFKPAPLTFRHSKIIKDYLPLRDAYLELYHFENVQETEHHQYRNQLNERYRFFISRYGDLNKKDNVSVIQTDAFGMEVLSLER